MTVKMKIVFMFLILFVFNGYSALYWQTTLGDDKIDEANSFCEDGNGNFIISGMFDYYSFAGSAPGRRCSWGLYSLDDGGRLLHQSVYGGSDENSLISAGIVKIQDNYYTASYTINKDNFFKMIKFNTDGDTIWSKKFQYWHENRWEIISVNTFKQKLLISAMTFPYGPSVMLIDTAGNELMRVHLEINGDVYIADCLQTLDNSLLVLGYDKTVNGNNHNYIEKLDSLGQIQWQKRLPVENNFFENYFSMCRTADDYFIISTQKCDPGSKDSLCFKKINQDGNLLWSRGYNNYHNLEYSDLIYSITQTSDSGFIACGSRNYEWTGLFLKSKLLLIKFDKAGEIEWKKLYGNGQVTCLGNKIKEINKRGYLIAGIQGNYANGVYNHDYLVMLVNSEGNITSIDSSDKLVTSLHQNYPNPFNPITTINYELSTANYTKLKVFNAKGELIKTLVDGLQNPGLHSIYFDGSMLNSGVYYYQLQTNSSSYVYKMILCK